MKLIISSLVLLALSAQAGVHGGNGPEQVGQSVPIALDRAVKLETVLAAQNKCYGDQLKEWVSLREGRQVYTEPNCDSSELYIRDVPATYILKTDYKQEYVGWHNETRNYLSNICRLDENGTNYNIYISDWQRQDVLSIDGAKLHSFNKLRAASVPNAYIYLGLPYYTFKVLYPDAAYDIDGVLNKSEAIAKDIRVSELTNDYRLKNSADGPSGYWVRPQKFKSCLERELFNSMHAPTTQTAQQAQ